jgi:hypothetical protein
VRERERGTGPELVDDLADSPLVSAVGVCMKETYRKRLNARLAKLHEPPTDIRIHKGGDDSAIRRETLRHLLPAISGDERLEDGKKEIVENAGTPPVTADLEDVAHTPGGEQPQFRLGAARSARSYPPSSHGRPR